MASATCDNVSPAKTPPGMGTEPRERELPRTGIPGTGTDTPTETGPLLSPTPSSSHPPWWSPSVDCRAPQIRNHPQREHPRTLGKAQNTQSPFQNWEHPRSHCLPGGQVMGGASQP